MLLARLLRPECYRVARVLQSYLDGEVDADTAGDVAAHLEHCRRCGLEAGTYRAIKAAIAVVPAGGRHPGEGVDADALARLRAFAVSLADDGPPDHGTQHAGTPADDPPAPATPSGA